MALPETKRQESNESEGGGQTESGGGGFFGIIMPMKKSGNRTKNNRNRRSSSSSNGDRTTGAAPSSSSSQRKVVKAIPPPAEDRNTQSTTDATIDADSDDRDIDRDAKRFALPGSAPAVEEETIRELSEKMRKERLDAAASKMKEHKEKGLDQKRRSANPSSGTEAAISSAPTAEDAKQRTVPDIFSVQPKFPEHKRNVEKASLPESEPLGKKYKVDSNPDESSSGAAPSKSWKDGLSGWMKIAVPSVAIAAVAAIIVMKVARKK